MTFGSPARSRMACHGRVSSAVLHGPRTDFFHPKLPACSYLHRSNTGASFGRAEIAGSRTSITSSPTGTGTEPPLPPRPLYDPRIIKRCSIGCASLTRIRLSCAKRAPVAAKQTTMRNRSPSKPCSSSISRAARMGVPICASVRIWLSLATDISSSSSMRSALSPSFTIEGNVGFSFFCSEDRRSHAAFKAASGQLRARAWSWPSILPAGSQAKSRGDFPSRRTGGQRQEGGVNGFLMTTALLTKKVAPQSERISLPTLQLPRALRFLT